MGGHGRGRRFDQGLWVGRLPPPGDLTIAISLPSYGIRETRRTVPANLVLDAAARSKALWKHDEL